MQLVMAAMTTAPWPISTVWPRAVTVVVVLVSDSLRPKPRSFTGAWRAFLKEDFIAERATRSCGRLGPASVGTTVPMSSSTVSVNTGSREASVRKRPCSLE